MSLHLARYSVILLFISSLFVGTVEHTTASEPVIPAPVTTETFLLADPAVASFDPPSPTELGPHTPTSPFNGIQFTWVVVGDDAALTLEYATLVDGVWSEWAPVFAVEEFLLPDAPMGTQTSTIFSSDAPADAWHIRITANGKSSGFVSSVRVTTMDTTTPAEMSPLLPTADLPLAAGAKPAIVARTTWGDSLVKSWDANALAGGTSNATWMPTDAEIAPPTHLIIHHTATPNDGPASDWPARVRQIWRYHTLPESNNWGDIGYHYLIDPNGVIYEGRFQGVRSDGTVIDGAHDFGFNRATIGISMLGTFDKVAPSLKAQRALDNLVAHLMTTYRIPPNTTQYYAHQGVTLNTILGHRDAQVAGHSTGCPGKILHGLLPTIRTKALAHVGTAPAQTWLTGVQVVDSDVFVGDPVTFQVTVRNAYADTPISGGAFSFLTSDTNYVYLTGDCWAKQDNAGSFLFPKAGKTTNRYNRFRIMAGISGWDALYAKKGKQCSAVSTENHPWRWSIGSAPLAPGANRVVTGSVRFQTAGTYTVYFGVMKDWIGYPDRPCSQKPAYAACGLFPKTITVRTRHTATATRPAALMTQIVQTSATAGAATMTTVAGKARLTQTAINSEFTATAAAAAGEPTYTASATPTSTATASAIPIQRTAQRLAGATQTIAARQTAQATPGASTPTITRTATRTPTAISFVRVGSIRTQNVVSPVQSIAIIGSKIVALESVSPAHIALYDPALLKRIQVVSLRGTSGLLISVDDLLPDTLYVAGNYTTNYIYIQRFRLINGTLRETGYWLTAQTGVPTSLMASGRNVSVAVHDTARNIHQLIRLDTKSLFHEGAPRLTLPGLVTEIVNSDGVSGMIVAAGQLPAQKGFLLPVTYNPDGTSRPGTKIIMNHALSSFCHSWRFSGSVPSALIIGADDTATHAYTQDLNSAILTGPTNTTAGANLMLCPTEHASFVMRVSTTAGTLSLLQPRGARFETRATALLPQGNGLVIRSIALLADSLIWTDGTQIYSAFVTWPR